MGNQHSNDGSFNFTQQEIAKLHKRFRSLDRDLSGQLEIEEFMNVPEFKQNPLVERLFNVFDTDHSNTISFEEFLKVIGDLYGNDEETKLQFTFSVYDFDGDGFISNGDLFKVLKMMIGNNLADQQLQQLVDRTIIKADEDFDGLLNFQEFKKVVKDLDISNKLTLQQI